MKITIYQATILLELINTRNEKGLWRPKLAEKLKTPKTTLFNNLKKLREKKLVDTYEEANNRKRGRSKKMWFATPLGHRAIKVIQTGIRK